MPDSTFSDSLIIPASLDLLGDVHQWASEHLKDLPLSPEKQYEILLSLSEVVTNAIRHGCRSKISERVAITIERTPDSFRITVQDGGKGFNPEALPDPTEPEQLLQPSGRGVFLIRSLADDVRFDFSGGTSVTAVFRFRA